MWRGGQAAIYDALPAPSFTALRRCDGVAGQRFCNARFEDRRARREVVTVPNEGGTPRAATKLAGMDARV